ncbi:TIGR02680 family protein, partial [Nocardiopsis tropica]|nr:TIGR02680 family protein [Nocardiopsis tropica]
LHAARGEAARHTADLDGRRETVARLGGRLEEDRERHEERLREHERAVAELTAREEGISAPVREIMAELEAVRESLRGAEAEQREVRARASAAHETMIRADRDLEHGQKALTDAFTALFEHADSFAALTHPDLRATLGVEPGPAWPDRGLWPEPEQAAEKVLAEGDADPGDAVRAVLPPAAAELTDAFARAFDPGRAVT